MTQKAFISHRLVVRTQMETSIISPFVHGNKFSGTEQSRARARAVFGNNFKDALAITGKGKFCDGCRSLQASMPRAWSQAPLVVFRDGDEVLITGCGLGESANGGLSEFVDAGAGDCTPGAFVFKTL